jgi:hypothetical protein
MIPQHLLHNLNLSSIAVIAAIAADGTLTNRDHRCAIARHCLVSGVPFCVWGCRFRMCDMPSLPQQH